MYLSIALEPGGWVSWIVVGLIAGAIASRLVQGRGMGCLLDIVVGIIGAFIGGFVVGLFMPVGAFGFIGTIVVAIIGATLLLALLRALSGRRF